MPAFPIFFALAEDGPRRVADLVNVSSVAGRVAGRGRGVYNLTKFGVGAFSESLRQEVTKRHVRVSLVEPGIVATELTSHNRDEVLEQMLPQMVDIEPMQSDDIADAIAYIVTRTAAHGHQRDHDPAHRAGVNRPPRLSAAS